MAQGQSLAGTGWETDQVTDPPLLAIVGPTASGKSGLAIDVGLRLAERGIAAEVVNADSMLVYRGMDIGTAKPSVAERRGVVHHLIDIHDPWQETSVADFQTMAREVIADCRSRGAIPIVVGGSALYLRAVLDRLEFPGTDRVLRARLETELAGVGPEALHRRLVDLDPEAAAGILPGNGRRIVRALEVVALTGGFRSTMPPYTYALAGVTQVGLALDRAEMDRRIEQRVELMWERGLVAEVAALAERGLRESRTASRALGYRQVLAHLDGESTEAEARAATITGTRRFARKQLMWWRHDPRIAWLDTTSADLVDQAISHLVHD
jgi:tRNA dimethylallyltransferase